MARTETFLREIVLQAGLRLKKHFGKVKTISLKGGKSTNLVTNVDEEVERLIKGEIHKHFPGDSILAEESAAEDAGSERRWIVDPLDGTTNFAHSFPVFCVSIGIEESREMVAGAIYNPVWEEFYFAVRGKGATLNGKKIHPSSAKTLSESLLVTGFPYDIHEHPESTLPYFDAMIRRAQGMRRVGSAALDLCFVAAGRFDGFFEVSLHPWDSAAGMVILQEAGGRITNFDGEPFSPYQRQLVASNGIIHEEMLTVIGEVKKQIGRVPV